MINNANITLTITNFNNYKYFIFIIFNNKIISIILSFLISQNIYIIYINKYYKIILPIILALIYVIFAI